VHAGSFCQNDFGEHSMIAKYNNVSLALGVPGLILQVAGNILSHSNRPLGGLLLLVGTALLVAGLAYYAIAKGRSGWWGLFGFLSIIGLIILACLKDRTISRRLPPVP
jgi:hypothetical protein